MRRLVALALLSAFVPTALTGCYSWTETDPYRPDLGGEERSVRLVGSDSTYAHLYRARVEDDTLYGWLPAGRGEQRTATALPLPLEDVERVEYRTFSVGKTVAAVLVPAGVVVALGALLASSMNFPINWNWDD